MIPALIETAYRSLFAGMTVTVVRRILPIRNLFEQKPAYGVVPSVSLAHPMTLLEELQATIQAKSGSGSARRPIAASIPATAEKSPTLAPATGEPRAGESGPSNTPPASVETQHLCDPAQAAEPAVRTWLTEYPLWRRDISIGSTL